MPLIVRAHLEWMRQRGLAESTIGKRRLVLARVARFTGRPACEASAADLAALAAVEAIPAPRHLRAVASD